METQRALKKHLAQKNEREKKLNKYIKRINWEQNVE